MKDSVLIKVSDEWDYFEENSYHPSNKNPNISKCRELRGKRGRIDSYLIDKKGNAHAIVIIDDKIAKIDINYLEVTGYETPSCIHINDET